MQQLGFFLCDGGNISRLPKIAWLCLLLPILHHLKPGLKTPGGFEHQISPYIVVSNRRCEEPVLCYRIIVNKANMAHQANIVGKANLANNSINQPR